MTQTRFVKLVALSLVASALLVGALRIRFSFGSSQTRFERFLEFPSSSYEELTHDPQRILQGRVSGLAAGEREALEIAVHDELKAYEKIRNSPSLEALLLAGFEAEARVPVQESGEFVFPRVSLGRKSLSASVGGSHRGSTAGIVVLDGTSARSLMIVCTEASLWTPRVAEGIDLSVAFLVTSDWSSPVLRVLSPDEPIRMSGAWEHAALFGRSDGAWVIADSWKRLAPDRAICELAYFNPLSAISLKFGVEIPDVGLAITSAADDGQRFLVRGHAPVKGAALTLVPVRGAGHPVMAIATSGGWFEFGAPRGHYLLTCAMYGGVRSYGLPVLVRPREMVTKNIGRLDYPRDELASRIALCGFVQDELGRPMGGTRLIVQDAASWRAFQELGECDSDGTFSFRVPAGRDYWLKVATAAPGLQNIPPMMVSPSPGATTVEVLTVPSGVLEIDAFESPGLVWLERQVDDKWFRVLPINDETELPVVVRALVPGDYRVSSESGDPVWGPVPVYSER